MSTKQEHIGRNKSLAMAFTEYNSLRISLFNSVLTQKVLKKRTGFSSDDASNGSIHVSNNQGASNLVTCSNNLASSAITMPHWCQDVERANWLETMGTRLVWDQRRLLLCSESEESSVWCIWFTALLPVAWYGMRIGCDGYLVTEELPGIVLKKMHHHISQLNCSQAWKACWTCWL